jgi:hypothetical protein
VIRETIREMDKVAIGRVVLTSREHIIALEAIDRHPLLRYPYEVRDPAEYFDEIQEVKVTKDMLDLARHIVDQKAGRFEPDKFEDQYETALVDLINQKRAGKPITVKARPSGENVVDLMEALRKSVGGAATESKPAVKPAKKSKKASAGQKELLMPIAGKKTAKETAAKKPAARSQRSRPSPREASGDAGRCATSSSAAGCGGRRTRNSMRLSEPFWFGGGPPGGPQRQAERGPRRSPRTRRWTRSNVRSASGVRSGGRTARLTSTATWRRTRLTPIGTQKSGGSIPEDTKCRKPPSSTSTGRYWTPSISTRSLGTKR